MKRFENLKRLGFFTRLLDEAPPAERYRLATEQIMHAEVAGLDSAWIAQHHFHETEGGLPAPFAFLGFVAAQTSRIRLGTGIVTLPLENPVRVAEDAAVLDLVSSGRFELGVGTGGNPSAFAAFGLEARSAQKFSPVISRLFAPLWRACRSPAAIRSIRRGRNCATGSGRRRFRSSGGTQGGQSGRRPAAVADAAAVKGCSARVARRDPASDHRRLSRRIAAGMRAPDHGVTQRLRRRRPSGRRCGWRISACGVHATSSSQAVTLRRGTHWPT